MNTRPLGQRERDVHRLLDDDDRHAGFLVHAVHDLEELADDRRRQAERQLVDHQQARVVHEHAGERHHLLLATGEVPGHLAVALAEDREHVEHLLEFGRDARFVVAEQPAGQAQVLLDGQGREHALAAGHQREPEAGHHVAGCP